MSFIKSRLRRLEGTTRGGPCPECKLSPDGPGYIVYAGDVLPDDPDERCQGCGRRLWFVIEVVEAGDSVEGEGASVVWPM